VSADLVLWGASGHAKVLAECADRLGYRVVALFDNDPSVSSPLEGVAVHGGWDGFLRWRQSRQGPVSFLVAIGGQKGADRLEIHERLERAGLVPVSIVHPTAFVAGNAAVDLGCQVLANAAVGVEARLGRQTIVNTSASVDHECVLGAGVHIAPGATLTGCVTVGDRSLVGAGAVVLPRVRIGRDVIIGAGSVVVRDVPDGTTVAGNPARVMRARAA
jgi:sugar O-acyltransferase (sialic acid O-acetyltransferase NeuD family)